MLITKKATPVTKQFMECLNMGLVAISPDNRNYKRNKRARREFKNDLGKGIPINKALERSLRIAAGGENARYKKGINVAFSHIPPNEPYVVRLYRRVMNRIFNDNDLEIRSGYKFPNKI